MPIREDEIQRLFQTGEINNADDGVLQDVLNKLSSDNVTNDGVRHREIIRGITINNIRMQRHIDGLNRQNKTTQTLVIALAGMSLIATVIQTCAAVRQPAASAPQHQTFTSAKAPLASPTPQTRGSEGPGIDNRITFRTTVRTGSE